MKANMPLCSNTLFINQLHLFFDYIENIYIYIYYISTHSCTSSIRIPKFD